MSQRPSTLDITSRYHDDKMERRCLAAPGAAPRAEYLPGTYGFYLGCVDASYPVPRYLTLLRTVQDIIALCRGVSKSTQSRPRLHLPWTASTVDDVIESHSPGTYRKAPQSTDYLHATALPALSNYIQFDRQDAQEPDGGWTCQTVKLSHAGAERVP